VNVHEDLLVGGEWRKPVSPARISVVCPSTEEIIGEVPDTGHEDVDVDRGTWRALSVSERAAVQAHYELKTINLDAPTAALFS